MILIYFQFFSSFWAANRAPGQPARFAVAGEHEIIANRPEQTRLFPIMCLRGAIFSREPSSVAVAGEHKTYREQTRTDASVTHNFVPYVNREQQDPGLRLV